MRLERTHTRSQSPLPAHGQLSLHSTLASATQAASHAPLQSASILHADPILPLVQRRLVQTPVVSQHSVSPTWPAPVPHTQPLQVESSQLGPPCALQQSPPGVGTGVGVGVGSVPHGQLLAQSVAASLAHVASQHCMSAVQETGVPLGFIPQQCGSSPQTHT